jgi:hypothetical protein
MYKQDKNGRTLRHLSGVEWARVRLGQNNIWQTQRISTATTSKEKHKKDKLKGEKNLIALRLPDIDPMESSSAKFPLPRERPKVDYRFILRGNDKLHREIMFDWEKTARVTLPSLSIQSLTEATKFRRKSWIQQVDTAIQFATNHSRRSFKTSA